jgi:hypothetical protein
MAAVGPPAFSLSSLQGPDIEREEGRTIIRFAPVDLRPHESVTLDPITLYSTQEAVSGPFVGEWRATATNVSGKVQRHLVIPTQRLELDMATALLSRRDDEA